MTRTIPVIGTVGEGGKIKWGRPAKDHRREFIHDLATFADSPAGEALIEFDPAKVVRMLIDTAKVLDK